MGNRDHKAQVNSKKWRMAAAALAVLIIIAALAIMIGAGREPDYTEGEFEISSLDMCVAVSKDHTYEVEEFISVDIPEALPRIEFAIPGGSSELEALTLEDENVKAVRRPDGDYVAVKDPELLTAGHHRYRITYKLHEPADGNNGKDVFSFDVLPAGWTKPIYKLHALMWFPYGFPLDGIQPYAGDTKLYNGSIPGVKVTVKIEPQSRSYTLGVRGIPEDYSIRVEADLPDGYWE